MALKIVALANAIEGLSITGLTIKDIDTIPAQAERRGAYMIPMADYATAFEFTPEAFADNDVRMYIVRYTVNYRLLYEPIGTGRTKTLSAISGLMGMIATILDKFLTFTTLGGVVDIIPQGVANAPVVQDPSGESWFGADISFRVTEYVNP